MPDRSRVARNTAFQYGLQIAKYLFPFITIPYLTRVLGPDVYAVRAYVLAAMTFMMVFLDFGFINYGTRAIAQARSLLEERRITTEITVLRGILCVVGALVLIPITASIPIMAAWPLYVALAYAGTCLKAFLPDFVFQGQEDMGIITNRYVVSQAVCVALIFLLVHGPEDLLWVPALEALGNLIALVWSWANVARKRNIVLVRVEFQSLRRAFAESGVFFVASASTTILSSLTTLCIGIFIDDPAQVSYWSIAMTAIVAVQSLYAPVTNSLYPHMVKRRDFALLKRLLLIGMPTVAVGTVAFAALSDVVMAVLGGPDYMDGAYVIAMVAPMLVVSFPAVMLGLPVLGAVGWVKQMTATSVAAAVVQVAGLFALVVAGHFTIEAVAVLRCCSEAALFLGRACFVLRFHRQANLARRV